MGYPWQTALGALFVSGVCFVLISVLPIRTWIINAFPRSLKLATAAGIGFFLTYAAIKLVSGRFRQLKPAVGALAVLFVAKIMFLGA